MKGPTEVINKVWRDKSDEFHHVFSSPTKKTEFNVTSTCQYGIQWDSNSLADTSKLLRVTERIKNLLIILYDSYEVLDNYLCTSTTRLQTTIGTSKRVRHAVREMESTDSSKCSPHICSHNLEVYFMAGFWGICTLSLADKIFGFSGFQVDLEGLCDEPVTTFLNGSDPYLRLHSHWHLERFLQLYIRT